MSEILTEIIVEKTLEYAVTKTVGFLINVHGKKRKELDSEERIKDALNVSLKRAIKFAENISIFKHPDRLDLETNSIELTVRNQDRRFYSLGQERTLEEIDLLKSDGHQILLGDPGAGKTTTLKRLVKKTFQLLESEDFEDFSFSFPIVVRLSEIPPGETLLTHLCHQLGVKYETVKVEKPYTSTEMVKERVTRPDTGEVFTVTSEVEVEKIHVDYERNIGNYPLKYAVGEYLNQLKSIIFLDGLDEVNYRIKDKVFDEIKELSDAITDGKLILSSRYLQEIPSFKQFAVNEIRPLDDDQKGKIADLWIQNTTQFFSRLGKLPYRDVADRPLFLTYLLRLFKANNDELPEQAVDVYRQIILLSIREWDDDKQQEIKRFSKYKTFNTYKKEDFLADLAFELTYSQGVKKVFNRDQLKNAYLHVFRKYPELTYEDKTDILMDVQSHNGLIIETGNGRFEFCHLSLQEYLCAKYILSTPVSRKHFELINIYPAPLAVANVLSSKPEEWFSVLFLTNIGDIKATSRVGPDKLFEYLDRLLLEKVVFSTPTLELGLAVLSLFFKYEKSDVLQKLIEFSKTRYVYESVEKALRYYRTTKHGKIYRFELEKKPISDFNLTPEAAGEVSIQNINHLVTRSQA
jgi:hypothetical protein